MGQTTSRQSAPNKKTDDKKVELYRPTPDGIRPCLTVTAIFLVVALIVWTFYSNVLWAATRNRLDYHRYCIDANEHRVLPPRNVSTLIEPPPFSYGYWALDYAQREVRWKLFDLIGTPPVNITIGSIDLRGPLRSSSPYVGEVAFAMGTQKDHHNRYFQGVEDISGRLATDIIERPYAYYISFQDLNGYEVARDSLTKTCYSNL